MARAIVEEGAGERFRIHQRQFMGARQRSETRNRLSDVSSQAPKPQLRFYFLFFSFSSLSVFTTCARLLQRKIRSSDKTRRVEVGGGGVGGGGVRGEKCGEACFSCRWSRWLVVRNRNANEHAGRHARGGAGAL